MKKMLGILKTTIFGGIIFLVPFIVIFAIVAKAFEIMKNLAAPLVSLAPVGPAGGVLIVNLIAIIFVVTICFFAGLAAKTSAASKVANQLETTVLSNIPFYSVIKGMVSSFSDTTSYEGMKTVLVRLDDYSQLAFEVERLDDGTVAVFLPGAPNPWSGTVCVMTADRVKSIDASMIAATRSIRSFGHGTNDLL